LLFTDLPTTADHPLSLHDALPIYMTRRGDNVLIVSNGFFGDRFIDICEHKGLNADVLKAEWGSVVSPEEIRKKLSEKHYAAMTRSEEHTSELQSRFDLVCRRLLEK